MGGWPYRGDDQEIETAVIERRGVLTEHVLADVVQERIRQERRFPDHTLAAAGMSHVERLAVIAEEFGEVAHDVSDLTWPRPERQVAIAELRTELLQLAACCVAWIEDLDAEAE
jgi:hypothetical protein